MPEPLICKDALKDALRDAATINRAADAVLTYLREVLTPEALRIYGVDSRQNGRFLHRRIFGEDK